MNIIGKFLVRKTVDVNNNEVLMIVGTALAKDFDLSKVNDNDEMWVFEAEIKSNGLRYTNDRPTMACRCLNGGHSPEDFLEGGMNTNLWDNKEPLIL